MKEEFKTCDVLVVGGGVAGMMAAIRAAEGGAKVIVAEKANTIRSGSAMMGVDHFRSYIPEYHGDFSEFKKALGKGQDAASFATKSTEYLKTVFENSALLVKKWEEWGIPIKYHGKYHFAGHTFPGDDPKMGGWLKISGMNIKPVLTEQSLNRSVEIVNRVMVFDLLKNKDNKVVGAMALHTRENIMVIFEANAVILSTGCVTGLYPNPTRAGYFNTCYPFLHSGDGRIMAYRAGAELADLELTRRHAGPKYLIKAGQASWVGVLRDREGNTVGPFLDKPDARYGDMTVEVNKEIFEEYRNQGKGPIYMDMSGITDKDYEEMLHYLSNQSGTAFLEHFKQTGVNLRNAAVEFTTFEHAVSNGIQFNHRGETGVNGLYAAGDESRGGLGLAATIGWKTGEHVAESVRSISSPGISGAESLIDDSIRLVKDIRTREVGACWQEAYAVLQQITNDYCGSVRSQSILEAGLDFLEKMKIRTRDTLKANDAHELMYCMQALNLMDLAELLFVAALDRKETRALHKRPDYPLTNPLLTGKKHIIKQKNGTPVTEWRNV
ncbi:MAG: FAD-binding protein [Bacillota bacterium]|nr:FAD-binding protein [Bacillota bacterium]